MSLLDPPQNTVTDVKFEDIVGEGKKYKTPEDAAKAIVEKDTFISRLQNENAEMRKSIVSQDRSQEILDRLEALRKTPTAESQPEPQVTERVVENKGITTEDVEKLLLERERRAQAVRNVETAKTELVKIYGNQYVDHLKNLAQSMGVTPEYLEGIAAQSPQALLKLAAPQSQETSFTPPQSSRPTDFKPSSGGNQKLSFYKQLQATNRAEYHTAKVQNKMYADAMALGEEFYDVPA